MKIKLVEKNYFHIRFEGFITSSLKSILAPPSDEVL